MKIMLAAATIALTAAASAGAQAASTYNTLYDFGAATYANPVCLSQGPAGSIIGSTGTADYGMSFKLFELQPPATGKTAWSFVTLADLGLFNGCAHAVAGGIFGLLPGGGPERFGEDPSQIRPLDYYPGYGEFFGVTPPQKGQAAGRFYDLYDFDYTQINGAKPLHDGTTPLTDLIVGQDGNLYGATQLGGTVGHGTIFRLTPPAGSRTTWRETNTFSFLAADGEHPQHLFAGPNGTFYGYTSQTDTTASTFFQVTPPPSTELHGSLRVLYRFPRGAGSYFQPLTMLLARNGEVFGTTSAGGRFNTGEFFRLTPPSAATSNWTFTDLLDLPVAGDYSIYQLKYIARDGSVYGVNPEGGPKTCEIEGSPKNPCGSIFRLVPPHTGSSGWTVATIHAFTGADGSSPFDLLPLSDDGTTVQFYGDASYGGSAGGGLIYKLAYMP